MTRRAQTIVDSPNLTLRQDLLNLSEVRRAVRPADQQHRSRVLSGENLERGRNDLRSAAALVLAQQDRSQHGSFGGTLDSTLRRMKNRNQIANQGESQLMQQDLRDRIALGRRDLTRRGRLQTTMQQLVNIREGVNVGISDANQVMAEATADLLGGSLGAGLAAAGDPKFRNNVSKFFRNIFKPKPIASSTETNLPSADVRNV